MTINGGTVVAKATQYTVTKVGDMTAAGIAAVPAAWVAPVLLAM